MKTTGIVRAMETAPAGEMVTGTSVTLLVGTSAVLLHRIGPAATMDNITALCVMKYIVHGDLAHQLCQ